GGVDLEEAGAVIAARKAILDAADGEFLVARAHEGFSGPFAAAIVVDRINIIESRDKLTLDQSFAGARREVPPAFGGPAIGILVTDRDPDAAAGIVAQAKIRGGASGPSGARQSQNERSRVPPAPP